jgi:hypothetical protein
MVSTWLAVGVVPVSPTAAERVTPTPEGSAAEGAKSQEVQTCQASGAEEDGAAEVSPNSAARIAGGRRTKCTTPRPLVVIILCASIEKPASYELTGYC